MKRIGMLLLLVAVWGMAGASLVTAQDVAAPKPVIIDVDMSMDDWMATLYMLQRTDVQVLAVTVSGTGMGTCDPGVQNAMNLVALAGNPDIPVACGRETPLKGTSVFPKDWRDIYNGMMGHELEANPNPPLDMTAVELLQQTLGSVEGKVTVLELGPHTNLAELFAADPALVERIEMVYMMGGALNVPGNVNEGGNTTAEWNIYADPLALAQVLETGVPLTLVPLDATNQVPMNRAFYKALSGDKTTPEAEFVFDVMTDIAPYLSSGFYFWDQLTAVALTDEQVMTFEDQTITVVTEEGDEFGRTMADPEGVPVRVAVAANAEQFEQIFLNGLNGRDA